MATPSTSSTHNNNNNNNTPASIFQAVVRLKNWWLVKAEKDYNGKRLAVAGYTLGEFFSSAPIIKRYDLLTLKTADGIDVSLEGSINRSRTLENGISSEACHHFVIGFPFYWEDFANPYMGEESASSMFRTSSSGLSNARDNPRGGDSKGNSCMGKTSNINADASNSSLLPDFELHAPEEILNGHGAGGTETNLNTATRKGTVYSTENSRLINTLEDCSVPAISNPRSVCPSKLSRGTLAGSSLRRLRSSREVEQLTSKINAILSPRINSKSVSNILLASPNKIPEFLNNHGDCRGDMAKDGTSKELLVALGSDANGVNQSEIDVIVPMETNSSCFKSSSEGLESSKNSNSTKLINLRSCGTKDDSLKDVSAPVDSEVISVISNEVKNVAEASDDNLIALSKKLETFNSMGKDNEKALCSSKSNGEKHFSVSFSLDKEPKSTLEAFANPSEKDLTKRSAFTASVLSEDKVGKIKKTKSSVKVRRSSRLNKANDTLLETGKNVYSVSLCPDRVENTAHNLYCESGEKIAMNLPSIPEGSIDLPSVAVGPDFGAEENLQKESCRSPGKLVDCTNDLKSSVEGEEKIANELGKSQKTAKRKVKLITEDVNPYPLTRNKKKIVSCVSPEYFSSKKSKSGRLLVRPLEFWCNEQVVYNANGRIVGVPKNMPEVESPTGNRSMPLKKKRRFV